MARRFKDQEWDLTDTSGKIASWQHVEIAVMMDIRDELKKLNALLHCSNFMAIPFKLDRISANTTKPRKKKQI